MGVYIKWECPTCRQWRRKPGECCGAQRVNKGWHLEYYKQGHRKTEKVESKARGIYLLSKRMDQPSVDKRLAADLFEAWVQGRKNQYNEEKLWVPLSPFFGHKTISDMTADDLSAYIKSRRGEGFKDSSIKRELSVLRAFYRRAKGDTAIFQFTGLKTPPKRLDKYLSDDEWLTYRDALPSHLVAFVTFLYETACRRKEASTLTWNRVDMERGLAWVEGKTGQGELQVVYLSPVAKSLLAGLPKSGELVFETQARPSFTITRIADSCGLNDTLRESGRSPITGCHFFRHAAISRWVQAGIDIAMVARLARHSNINQTYQYSHLRPDDLHATLAKLAAVTR